MLTPIEQMACKTICHLGYLPSPIVIYTFNEDKKLLVVLAKLLEYDWAKGATKDIFDDCSFFEIFAKHEFDYNDNEKIIRCRNILEVNFLDIEYNGKIFIFYSPNGLCTSVASIIITTFSQIEKVKKLPNELLPTFFEDIVQTHIIAQFLIANNAETGFQTIKLPPCINPNTVTERFHDKFIGGGRFSVEEVAKEKSILDILRGIKKLSSLTNEGARIKLNAVLYLDQVSKSPIENFVKLYTDKKFAENFCFFNDTILQIDSFGMVFGYITCNTQDEKSDIMSIMGIAKSHAFAQKHRPCLDFIRATTGNNKALIGIILDSDGTISIYYISGLLCFYKKGQWHFFFGNKLASLLVAFAYGNTSHVGAGATLAIDEILQTIIDLIISHKGACIGILPEKNDLFNTPDENDFFVKASIIGKEWNKIPPQQRVEISSVDGAILLEDKSYIIKNIGKILNIDKGEPGDGGRTSAAKFIAKNDGIGIKISEDGNVNVYIKKNGDVIKALSMGEPVSYGK